MSENKHNEEKDKEVALDNEQTADVAAESTETPEITEESACAEEEADKTLAELNELKAKMEEQRNDYLRLMADFENFRRRTLKEKSELIKNGGEDTLKKLLPVVDDFERAMAALESSDDINAIKEGVSLIYNKFQSFLEGNGVKEIPAVGEAFDTEVHEAITTFPAPTPEQKGKVIDCVTKGYTLNDKVIRHSKVVVGE